jgi:hypothetical protein
MSLDLDESLQAWVVRAGVVLLTVQGLANMLLVYQHEFDAMPVQVVTRFFPMIDGELALRLNAMIQGLALSIVSLAFWNVWAQMLKREWQTKQRQFRALESLDELLK